MTYDLIRWASHMCILLAASMGGCFLMMDNKRGPMALAMLACALFLVSLVVLHSPDGRTWAQYFLTKAVM